MKIFAIAFACGALFAAEGTQTFEGVITDTMCGAKHTMMPGKSDDECIRACLKHSSSQYALYDGKTVMRLSDQKSPAKLAAQKVKVTGTYNEKTKTIKVSSMEASN
ncbi:MAG TPA: hypothetical protein VKU01_20545 [Bryobacteraceae bacterium]|nr:hypothetical protein [Bryobacteraceae bacterium]